MNRETGTGVGRGVGVVVGTGAGTVVGAGAAASVSMAAGSDAATATGVGTGVEVAVSGGVVAVTGAETRVAPIMASTVAWTLTITVAAISGASPDTGLGRAARTSTRTVASMSGVEAGGATRPGVGTPEHATGTTISSASARTRVFIAGALRSTRW
jgi:hypothetical protein